MYAYAKVVDDELFVRGKHKRAGWEYVCHVSEIGRAPINNMLIRRQFERFSLLCEVILSNVKQEEKEK